jgi:2,4-dienoyl-CoA reductase-like NADH-dependent reductase (Old Yellow Enzyme family)
LHEIQLAARLINEQHADIVAIGKAAIANPNWPQLIRRDENARNFVAEMIHPYVTLENTSAYLTQFPERLL